MSRLFCFGFGFSAARLAGRLAKRGFAIAGTSRSTEGKARIETLGHEGFVFDGSAALPPGALDDATLLLLSAPPGEAGDPVIMSMGNELRARARQFVWAGYLSTTGVYGDKGGAWVDEESRLCPNTERGRRRLAAERAWLALHETAGLPLHVFRLAGIYGDGRNQLLSVLDGTARRIVKPGQVFSRIHVDDIAGVLEASIARPNPGAAYNVCDDEPCPPQDVIAFAASLLDRPLPPEIPFGEAELTPMAKSFYADSKRVSNRRIKEELGYRLLYPTYREGLRALAQGFRR